MLEKIRSILKESNTTLVAVSKMRSLEQIMELYDQGQRIFGENRVQELLKKQKALPKDIEWHLIGHLQSKKVKQIAPFVSMIHSVDSFKLLEEINKQAERQERKIRILLQCKIAEEESKYGFTINDISKDLEEHIQQSEHLIFSGVMGMATFTDNEDQVSQEFKTLKAHFDQLKEKFFLDSKDFVEISMGMSGDYKLAIAEGSTMVRIGSLLF